MSTLIESLKAHPSKPLDRVSYAHELTHDHLGRTVVVTDDVHGTTMTGTLTGYTHRLGTTHKLGQPTTAIITDVTLITDDGDTVTAYDIRLTSPVSPAR